jgi:signal transduction histidine kinase
VSDLPPPTGRPTAMPASPPTGSPPPVAPRAPGAATTPGRAPGRPSGPLDGWDRDRIRATAEQWYRPLLDLDSWRALGYLALGALTGPLFFALAIATGVAVAGLIFVVVGVLLVGPWFGLVAALCRAERAMAGWVGVDIPPRPLAAGGALGWRAVTDRERWRQVGYLGVNLLLGPILFGFGSFAHSLVLQVVFGDGGPGGLLTLPINTLLSIAVAAVALGAAPRLAMFMGHVKARIAAWFLGPDELAIARQRVSTLATQRHDILDAVAAERRRIERNLHDGVQQQLVAIGLDLGMAEQQIERDPARARELLGLAREKVQGSIGELRQLGRGLHPAILADRGLDAALSAVVSGAPIPISVHVDPDLDLSTDTAETVYFVANEAIANVLKHARARSASVQVTRLAANVRVVVHDDGVGGVEPSRGTGIAGIRARVNAVDGSFTITSPPGGPTTLVAELARHDGSGGSDA